MTYIWSAMWSNAEIIRAAREAGVTVESYRLRLIRDRNR